MEPLIHDDQTLERWREGVMTRMLTSARLGSHQLCIFEQYCDPGLGAPTHVHAVEEVLQVMDGVAEIWLESRKWRVEANQSVLIPAGAKHGFRNAGQSTLHMRSTLAASVFEASYDDRTELSRRWSPDLSKL